MTGFIIRDYRHTDENFVMESWLNSFSHSQHGRIFGAQDGKVWNTIDKIWSEHRRIAMALIVEAKVYVVCDDDDEDTIFGWACLEPGVLHYAVVKNAAVDSGLGTEMAKLLLGEYMGKPMMLSHEPAWVRHTPMTRLAYENKHPEYKAELDRLRAIRGKQHVRGPRAPTCAMTDAGVPLPYYHQESDAWFPIPRAWKVDNHWLARKWCPVAKERAA